jgi:CRP/FNR family transcriptional regulator, cyclic AMP receptor protein
MLLNNSDLRKLEGFFRSNPSMVRQTFKKGEVIVRTEEDPRGVYFIESGYVKASVLTKYGEENMLIVRGSGEVFPLIWVFYQRHRGVAYQAMSPTVLLRVNTESFLKYLEDHPKEWRIVLAATMEAYRLHSERVMTLSYRTARERIVAFLVTCAYRFGKKTAGGTLIEAPLRQHDIASSVNATRETASRELSVLNRKKLIISRNGMIIVPDIDKLKELL